MPSNEQITTLINQISNVQLALLGISITIFTVIYSFIINKKEELLIIASEIKSGNKSPLKLQKESFLIKNITKLKSVNNKLLVLVCYSFLYLIYSWISSNFSVCISIKYYYLNLILLSLEFIIISFILIKLFINYKKETKI